MGAMSVLISTAAKVLTKAADLVGGERAEAHGDFFETHDNIARLWNGYLHNIKTLTAHDVCNLLELMKVARRKNGQRNEDDYVDGAGYSGGAWQCAVHEEMWKETKEVPDTLFGGMARFHSMENEDEDEPDPTGRV